MEQPNFDREVDLNYAAFEASLGTLLESHRGMFALLKGGEITDFYQSEAAALSAGKHHYPDRLFSIQEVTDRPVDLGFFSHAIHTRIA